jgi:membrane protein DedA with SNARE-associated domain
MLAENIFPPIPSEVILPLAGYTAVRSGAPFAIIVVAGTLGSVAGALFWYWIGRAIGVERVKDFARRHGRWLTLSPSEVEAVDLWFDRYGQWAVLIGRMVPGVRTLISIPAGVTRMPILPFLIWSTLGSALWTTALVLAGYELGERYRDVASIVEPASNAVLAGMVAWYFWRVATFKGTRRG